MKAGEEGEREQGEGVMKAPKKASSKTSRRSAVDIAGKKSDMRKVVTGSAAKKKSKEKASGQSNAFTVDLAPGLGRLLGRSKKHAEARRALEEKVMFTAVLKPNLANSVVTRVMGRLRKLGFEIFHRGEFGISLQAPAKLVAGVLNIELVIQARSRRTRLRATQSFAVSFEPPAPEDLYVVPTESLSVASNIAQIERFLFMPPPEVAALQPVAPNRNYFGIDSVAIRRLLNVPPGAMGSGVRVGMVDTGFFPHPYYAANNLAYLPTPTASVPNPQLDVEGHGTAMAFNTFAVAPGVMLMGFKKSPQQPHVALEDAARAGADVITCSWGWRDEQPFKIVEDTINAIVAQGKIVLFASGDGLSYWPASMPAVLAIGGVYADANNQLEASNSASGFPSKRYSNRQVPDVCGLCGQKPMGIYITLPCPPGSSFDKHFAGMSFPDRDETLVGDGWCCASGTSSATAQIAGVVALMIERARALGRPPLNTARVKQLLQQTATPVQRGKNAQGAPASGHPNGAVGFGLVNAAAAIAAV